MSLTRTPLAMLDAGSNAQANDQLVFNGADVEAQSVYAQDGDHFVNGGNYDQETGILSLTLSDNNANVVGTINIGGFTTAQNIGVGPRGATGPRGAQGQNGRNGKDGVAGAQGCIGPKGDGGPAGPTGPVGPTGPQGEAGPTGLQGLQGLQGPAGVNGETPILTEGTVSTREKLNSGRIMQWGRFTDNTPGEYKRILFPESFVNNTPKTIILQWVNPDSNVAYKCRITDFTLGYCEIGVNTSLLDTEPDGAGGTQPVAMSGWDFYWFAVGV